MDFNPSEMFWYNEKLENRDDVKVIHSTYKDNPFLPNNQVVEIERLKETDDIYWQIYGLGEFAGNRKLIYQYNVCETIPIETAKMVALGLDWGYSNDETALVEIWKNDNQIYINELIYEKGLTNSDLATLMKHIGVDRYIDIYCDSAEPKSIEELRRFGFNAKAVIKGPDSVMNGIDILRRHRINITKDSTNVIREMSRYKWMEKDGVLLNKPIDMWNHSLDAIRYVALMKLSETKRGAGKYNISVLNSRGQYNLA